MATPRKPSSVGLNFGRFVQQLRKDQEQLAEHSGLAADTIRRVERGLFSPSLDTLTKLTTVLRIDLEVLFTGFVRGETATGLELLALARSLNQDERVMGLRILVVLVGLLGAVMDIDRGGRRNA